MYCNCEKNSNGSVEFAILWSSKTVSIRRLIFRNFNLGSMRNLDIAIFPRALYIK